MSDDEFEDEPELDEEDLDEEVLDEDFDDDDDDDDLLDDELDEDDRRSTSTPSSPTSTVVVVDDPVVDAADDEEDDDVVDLDEELHPDDVEEALDVVLRERTAAAGLEDDEEDDDEPDEPGEGGTKIVPRRENEFLCKSCFLVLPAAPARRREADDLSRLRVSRAAPRRRACGSPPPRRRASCSALSRPPVDIGPLACVALVPLFLAWRGRGPRARRGLRVRRRRRLLRARCVVDLVLRRGRDRAVRRCVLAAYWAAAGAVDRLARARRGIANPFVTAAVWVRRRRGGRAVAARRLLVG